MQTKQAIQTSAIEALNNMKYQFKGRRYNFHPPVAEALTRAIILSDVLAMFALVVILGVLIWIVGALYSPIPQAALIP